MAPLWGPFSFGNEQVLKLRGSGASQLLRYFLSQINIEFEVRGTVRKRRDAAGVAIANIRLRAGYQSHCNEKENLFHMVMLRSGRV